MDELDLIPYDILPNLNYNTDLHHSTMPAKHPTCIPKGTDQINKQSLHMLDRKHLAAQMELKGKLILG